MRTTLLQRAHVCPLCRIIGNNFDSCWLISTHFDSFWLILTHFDSFRLILGVEVEERVWWKLIHQPLLALSVLCNLHVVERVYFLMTMRTALRPRAHFCPLCRVVGNNLESFWLISTNSVWLILTHFDSFWLILTHFDSFWLILTHLDSFWLILTHIDSYWLILTHVD